MKRVALTILVLFMCWSADAQTVADESGMTAAQETPVVAPTPMPPPAPSETKRRGPRFALGALLTSEQKLKFDKVKFSYFKYSAPASSTYADLKAELDIASAHGLTFDLRSAPGRGLGFQVGFEHRFDSELKNLKLIGNAGSLTLTAKDVKYGSSLIFVNMTGGAEWWYFLGGINYTSNRLKGLDGATMSNGPGVQGGVGAILEERFCFELMYYDTLMSASYSEYTATTTGLLDFGIGNLTGVKLVTKFLF